MSLDWYRGLETDLDFVDRQWHFGIRYAGVVIDELVIEEFELWRYE